MSSIISDPYMDFSRVYYRLREEYKKYGKLIIAVDFDDTIFNTHDHEGWCYHQVVKTLLRWQGRATIIVWTASLPERYEFISSVFRAHGIAIDGINVNAPGIEARGPKIYANVYLDDRSFGLNDAVSALNRLADANGF